MKPSRKPAPETPAMRAGGKRMRPETSSRAAPKSQPAVEFDLTEAIRTLVRSNGFSLVASTATCVMGSQLTPSLQTAMGIARRAGQLRGGLETIEALLQREETGLVSVAARTQSQRGTSVSRLLVVSNDGSDRFYRQCASLLERYGHRLACLKLDVSAQVFGERFFGPGAQVKAALITRREFVIRVVQSLLSVE